MLSKNEIKNIQSLRYKKSREEARLFAAEGPKITCELVQLVPQQVKKLYALKDWVERNDKLIRQVEHEIISEMELEKLSQLQTPNEVVCILHHFESHEPVIEKEIILYLDAIQDPGNFGTIIRIADWFGIKHIVCGEGCADIYNIKVVQATMASIARVNVFYDEAFQWLKRQDSPKYATTLDGQSIYSVPKIVKGIIIIGNESKGIQSSILDAIGQKITIPKFGAADSLNAAVATGIILSHLISRI